MDWVATDDGWDRADGTATVRLRRTADGRWAVTYDRLAQAPEGADYRRETVDSREAAEAIAADWRERNGDHDHGDGRD
jgi:hypothetical protein